MYDIPSKIAMTYVHHNEPEWKNVWNNPVVYNNYAESLKRLVEGLVNKGAAINLQISGDSILADEKWGTGELYNTLYNLNPNLVSIDAHGHDDVVGENNLYNTADSAYLLNQLGLPDTGIVGGYLLKDQPKVTMPGNFYDYEWYPTALWGGATNKHINDPYDTGIRKEGDLLHIGGLDSFNKTPDTVGGNLDYLKGLLQEQPYGNLFTSGYFIGSNLRPETVDDWIGSVDRINSEVGDAGYWSTLGNILSEWNNSYNSYPSYYSWY